MLPILVALVLVPVACSSGGDDAGDGTGGGGDSTATRASAQGEPGAAPGVSGGGGEEAVDGSGLAADRLPRLGERIIQTATIRVTVRKDGLGDALERARTVADELGGFIVRSSTSVARRGEPERASIVLRVPSRSYVGALDSLGELGRVEAQRERAEGVSQEFVDLEARARHLRAVELQLLELLNRAHTVPAALAVQDRLNAIQLELEQVRGRLRFLEDQTAYATISVSIRERGVAAATGKDEGWGVVEAWRDGAEAFTRVAGRAFVVLAGAAPLVLLALLAFIGLRHARRRWIPARSAPRA